MGKAITSRVFKNDYKSSFYPYFLIEIISELVDIEKRN